MASVGSVEIQVGLGLQRLLQDARKAQDQLRSQLKDLEIQLGVKLDPKSSKDVIAFQRQLQAEILRTQAALSKDKGQSAALERQAKLLQEQIRYKQQLAQIKTSLADPKDVANAEKLAAALSRLNVAKIQQEFEQASNEMSEFGRIMEGVGQGVGQSLANIPIQAFTQAIDLMKQALQQAIATFIEFDDAIKQTGVISGASAEGIQAIREEAERLGVVTSKSPAEVAQMSIALSRAGFAADETVVALEGIVRASEATGSSLENVGDLIAKTIRAYGAMGVTVDDTAAVGDALVATVNNTNTSIETLAESLKYVAPAASAANQPLEDTLVLIGLLGDQGLQGSTAGTGLAMALERLKQASAGVDSEFADLVRGNAKAMEAFEAIGTGVRNTDGSMKSLLEILPLIQANLSNLSQADQDLLMKALFGTEGGRAFQALLNTSQDRIELITDAVRNSEGVATESGEAMLQGLGGALQLIGGSLESLSIQFGAVFAPALEAAVRAAIPLVNAALSLVTAFNGLPTPLKNVVLGISGIATALTAAIAVTTAYQLILKQEVVTKALTTTATIADTIAKTANTVATQGLSAAIAGMNKQLAITVLKAGLAAGAIAVVAANLQLWQGITAAAQETERSFDELNKVLREQDQILAANADTVEEAAAGFEGIAQAQRDAIEGNLPVWDEQLQKIRDVLGLVDEWLDKLGLVGDIISKLSLVELFGGDSGETATNRQIVAFEELRTQIDGVIDDFQSLSQEQINALDDEEIEAWRAKLESAIATMEAQEPATAAGIAAQQNYIAVLRNSISALDERSNAEIEVAESTEDSGDRQANVWDGLNRLMSENEQSYRDRQATIAETYADEDTQRQANLQAEQDYLNARVEINQAMLRRLRQELHDAGTEEEQADLNNRILELEQQLSDDRLAIAQNGAARREEAERQALAGVQTAVRESQAAIAAAVSERTASVRQAQIDGVLGEQEAAQQIAQIQLEASQQAIAQKQEELAALAELNNQGNLSDEEFRQREIQLTQEMADLQVGILEQQLQQERQLQEQYFSDMAAAFENQMSQRQQQLDQRANSLERENSLLSAQSGLLSSQNTLEEERLETRIAQAEATGDDVEAERLRNELSDLQVENMREEFDMRERQLALANEMAIIDQQNAILSAERAVSEARIALLRAQQSGASVEELALLQQILSASEQQLQHEREALETRRRINELSEDQLANERAISEENARQAEIQRNSEASGSSGSGGGGSGSSGSGSSGGSTRRYEIGEYTRGKALAEQFGTKAGEYSRQYDLADLVKILETANQTNNNYFKDFANQIIGSNGEVVQLLSALKEQEGASGSAIVDQLSNARKEGQITDQELITRLRELVGANQEGNAILDSLIPKATGGSVVPGHGYLVGEHGPEFVSFARSGWVHTAAETAKLLGSIGVSPEVGAIASGLSLSTMPINKLDGIASEISKLRRDVSRLRSQNNSITIQSQQPIQDASELLLQMQRDRLRALR